MQYTGVPNMAETIPLSPDQVNACVGSVNGTSKKGGRITHSSLRMPMLFLAALACVQTPVNAWEAELGCEKFSEVFTGGKDVCESIFGDAFVYRCVTHTYLSIYLSIYLIYIYIFTLYHVVKMRTKPTRCGGLVVKIPTIK